jgi:hypothetical protein
VSRRSRIVRVEDLLGQRVRTAAGDVIGRIEEIRVERHGDDHEVTDYLLGGGALAERLAIAPGLFGRHPTKLVARWDQLDIHRPDRPVLTCPVEELERE